MQKSTVKSLQRPFDFFLNDLITSIFLLLDFSGKLYFALTCKKYYVLYSEKTLENFKTIIKENLVLYSKSEKVCLRLCIDGHVKLLKNFFKVDAGYSSHANNAIKYGVIEIVDAGYSSYINNAIKYGVIDILNFLVKNGYKLWPHLYEISITENQLAIFKWLEGKKVTKPIWLCNHAADIGNLDMMKHLRSIEPPMCWNNITLERAVESNNFELIKWMLDNDDDNSLYWDENIYSNIASTGNLKMLKFFRKLNPTGAWFEYTFPYAAGSGNLKMVKWLKAYKNPECPWDEDTCTYAALSGKLEILKWLRSQDPPCPWDENIWGPAIRGGNLEVLEWIKSPHNGGLEIRPQNLEKLYKYAEDRERPDVLAWLKTL
jgi:hypothetical protein